MGSQISLKGDHPKIKTNRELSVKFRFLLVMVLFCIPCLLVMAEAATPRDLLQQLTADLQNSPKNQALREQIIKLALTLDPAPVIPDEVATHEGAAEYAFKNAKTEADYADTAKEYEKALLAAPWLAAVYFNCGVAYEKAGDFDGAIHNFNYYLMAAPDAPDVIEVRKRIGGLKYAVDKAIKERSEAVEKKRLGMAPKDLSGIWWQYDENNNRSEVFHYRIQVQGDEVLGFTLWDMNYGGELKGSERLEFRARLQDRTIIGKYAVWAAKPSRLEGIVTEDFGEINCKSTSPSGEYVSTWSLRRE